MSMTHIVFNQRLKSYALKYNEHFFPSKNTPLPHPPSLEPSLDSPPSEEPSLEPSLEGTEPTPSASCDDDANHLHIPCNNNIPDNNIPKTPQAHVDNNNNKKKKNKTNIGEVKKDKTKREDVLDLTGNNHNNPNNPSNPESPKLLYIYIYKVCVPDMKLSPLS